MGKDKIRVAIIGVGNCSSSLVQGVDYYKNAADDEFIPGLMHVNLGGYHISDIEFSAAFDIDANKVGKDLSEAIFSGPNNTYKFSDVPGKGVKVSRGMTHDGLGKYLSQIITKAPGHTADIVKILKDTETDVVINYLPVGSEDGHQVVCRAGARGGLRLGQLHSGLHRARRRTGASASRKWPADHRRRHQDPGRRHHRPPRADAPLPRARCQAGAHDAS